MAERDPDGISMRVKVQCSRNPVSDRISNQDGAREFGLMYTNLCRVNVSSRYMSIVLAYYSHLFIGISVVSVSHSCLKRRGSESVDVAKKESPNKFSSTKSSSSVEHPHEITPKSSVDWDNSKDDKAPVRKSADSSTATAIGSEGSGGPVSYFPTSITFHLLIEQAARKQHYVRAKNE
ncbi:hypothetical protein COOONC_12357 [Cooperia oncophora]